MNAYADAVAALRAALSGVEGVRHHSDTGKTVQPPATLLGPPTFAYETYTADPSTATVVVALVVKAGDDGDARLLALLPAVTAAIHNNTDAVVLTATPGSWTTGGSDLPAYLIELECSL